MTEYKYKTYYGFEIYDVSFETSERLNYSKNARVTISVSSTDPLISRIKGLRRSIHSDWAAYFIIVGLFSSITGIIKGVLESKKWAHLLSFGSVTYSHLVSKVKTNKEINEEPVYDLTFKFKDKNNIEYFHELSTHKIEKVTDDEFELLIYEPENPEKSVLIDYLPFNIKINPDGEFL